MSLINTMLRDLEDSGRRDEIGLGAAAELASVTSKGRGAQQFVLLVTSLLLTAGGGYWIWGSDGDLMQSLSPVEQGDQPVVASAPAKPKSIKPQPVKKVNPPSTKLRQIKPTAPKPSAPIKVVSPAKPAQSKQVVAPKVVLPKVVVPLSPPEPAPTMAAKPMRGTEKPKTAPQSPIAPALVPEISKIEPQKMVGSRQRQPLAIRGSGITAETRVVLCWPSDCAILRGGRLNLVSEDHIEFSIKTGVKAEMWTVQLLNRDGARSNTLELEIVAPESIAPIEVVVADIEKKPPQAVAPKQPSLPKPQQQNSGDIERTILPLTPLQRAEQRFIEAENEFRLGHQDLAAKGWKEALQIAKDHHKSRGRLSAYLISKGRLVEAQQLLDQGYRIYPNYSPYVLMLARLAVEHGETTRAMLLLEERLAEDDPGAEILAMAAALYQRNGELKKSIDAYQQAIALENGKASWWLGMGISLDQNQEGEPALRAYRKAMLIGGLKATVRDYLQGRIKLLERSLSEAPAEESGVVQTESNEGAAN